MRVNYNDKIDNIIKKQDELEEKFGYYLHVMTNDLPDCITGKIEPLEFINQSCNIHTHGLMKNFNHPDLRIVSTFYGIKISIDIINYFGGRIKLGMPMITKTIQNININDRFVKILIINDIDEPGMIRIIIMNDMNNYDHIQHFLNQFKPINDLKIK